MHPLSETCRKQAIALSRRADDVDGLRKRCMVGAAVLLIDDVIPALDSANDTLSAIREAIGVGPDADLVAAVKVRAVPEGCHAIVLPLDHHVTRMQGCGGPHGQWAAQYSKHSPPWSYGPSRPAPTERRSRGWTVLDAIAADADGSGMSPAKLPPTSLLGVLQLAEARASVALDHDPRAETQATFPCDRDCAHAHAGGCVLNAGAADGGNDACPSYELLKQ